MGNSNTKNPTHYTKMPNNNTTQYDSPLQYDKPSMNNYQNMPTTKAIYDNNNLTDSQYGESHISLKNQSANMNADQQKMLSQIKAIQAQQERAEQKNREIADEEMREREKIQAKPITAIPMKPVLDTSIGKYVYDKSNDILYPDLLDKMCEYVDFNKIPDCVANERPANKPEVSSIESFRQNPRLLENYKYDQDTKVIYARENNCKKPVIKQDENCLEKHGAYQSTENSQKTKISTINVVIAIVIILIILLVVLIIFSEYIKIRAFINIFKLFIS